MVEPSKAASMIGYVTVGIALVPMIGPILGGLIEQTLGWQAVFWLFVASGLGVYWLVWVDLGETNANRSASFAAPCRAMSGELSPRLQLLGSVHAPCHWLAIAAMSRTVMTKS